MYGEICDMIFATVLQFIRDRPEDVVIEDISDGHINDVLRVSCPDDVTKSVIVKYAPPYFKVSCVFVLQH